MKHFRLTILFLTITFTLFSQIYEGNWEGKVSNTDTTFTLRLILKQKNDQINGWMLQPEWLKVVDFKPEDSILTLKSQQNEIHKLENFFISDEKINVDFKYHGSNYQIELKKEGKVINRPQEPKKPYPYISEDIFFKNTTDSTKLAGTLTIPDTCGSFPAVILISGSNPTDRNCENYHHRPFLVIADYLTKKGFAVLRYDDRGVNGSSGDFYQSTLMDFSHDVISAFEYLCSKKEIDTNKIGLIGHSEGGIVAAITASKNTQISFIVLLASPGIKLKDAFGLQQELKYKSGDLTKEQYEFSQRFDDLCYQLIENGIDYDLAKDSLSIFREEYKLLDSTQYDFKDIRFQRLIYESLSPHNQFNIKCNPSDYLEKVRCPVLSLNGSSDILVPATINQDAIREALTKAENSNFKIIELESLNHGFQECETGSLKESFDIEQTFSPIALEEIKNWITSLY